MKDKTDAPENKMDLLKNKMDAIKQENTRQRLEPWQRFRQLLREAADADGQNADADELAAIAVELDLDCDNVQRHADAIALHEELNGRIAKLQSEIDELQPIQEKRRAKLDAYRDKFTKLQQEFGKAREAGADLGQQLDAHRTGQGHARYSIECIELGFPALFAGEPLGEPDYKAMELAQVTWLCEQGLLPEEAKTRHRDANK